MERSLNRAGDPYLVGKNTYNLENDPSHIASVLFLDVSGAFDHVSHARLLHNLQKRRIDHDTVGWIASFLGNRTTTIRMGDVESDMVPGGRGNPTRLTTITNLVPFLQCGSFGYRW